MKKYYCDKCKKELDKHVNAYTIDVERPEFSFNCCPGFKSVPIHLCPECMLKFYKWLEGKDE